MDIRNRLDLLKKSGTISQESYDDVLKVAAYFREKNGITLTEENASAFVTHLAMALERVRKGEKVVPLDRGVYEAATREPTFAQASSCCRDIRRILPQIPEAESEYICTHVGVLLARIKEGGKQ